MIKFPYFGYHYQTVVLREVQSFQIGPIKTSCANSNVSWCIRFENKILPRVVFSIAYCERSIHDHLIVHHAVTFSVDIGCPDFVKAVLMLSLKMSCRRKIQLYLFVLFEISNLKFVCEGDTGEKRRERSIGFNKIWKIRNEDSFWQNVLKPEIRFSKSGFGHEKKRFLHDDLKYLKYLNFSIYKSILILLLCRILPLF